ncbi:MAG: diacylglycerol kinase family lipid kinase [Candidatus Aminicenantes bacterium]|nr:diacylglycerol kinase family lipid kinase [Candidatus Aminicenantes bacterium]
MTTPAKHIILNPASAAGKTGRRQDEIVALFERVVGGEYSLCITRRPGEATDSSKKALGDGAELIVAVGGDGTIQEVVNGFFSGGRLISPRASLGIINAGTGHGFAQSLGLPEDLERQMRVAAGRTCRLIDVGWARFMNGGAKPVERYFINECQAGIGGEVVRRVGAGRKQFGGALAFGLTSAAAALNAPSRPVTVQVDDEPARTHKLIGIVMANGGRMAGGMNLTPSADLSDGLLDILLIHEQSRFERLRNFPKIYSGKHVGLASFSYRRGRRISVSSAETIPFEADGELWGTVPCRVEVLPGLLRVKSPVMGRE